MRKEITTGARRGGRRRWLAVILLVCMIVTMLPAAAAANDDIMELKLMPEPFQAIQSMTPGLNMPVIRKTPNTIAEKVQIGLNTQIFTI